MIFHNNPIHLPHTNFTLPARTFPLHNNSFASIMKETTPLHRTTFLKTVIRNNYLKGLFTCHPRFLLSLTLGDKKKELNLMTED